VRHSTERAPLAQHRRTIRTHLLCSCLALRAAALTACTPKLCDTAIDPNNAQYDVNVVRIYSVSEFYSTLQGYSWSSDTPSCDGIDGIAPGSLLRFETIGQMPIQHGQCNNVTAEVAVGPNGLIIQDNILTAPPGITVDRAGVVMYAMMDATFGDCAGQLVIEFYAGPGNVFAPPVDAGGYQPAVMYRLFYPAAGSCPRCNDNFIVQFVDAKDAGVQTVDD